MKGAVILVGTETGTAEDVAFGLAATLRDVGIDAEIVDMEDADAGLLDGERGVVVCTATHGDGELPYNSLDFYEALDRAKPDLSGLLFCVCGLGDRAYPDFCMAGKTWSRFLSELGAREVLERHELDGLVDDADVDGACEWVQRAARSFEDVPARRP